MDDMFREPNYLSCNPKSSKAVEEEKNSAFSRKQNCGRVTNDTPPKKKKISRCNPQNL